LQYTHQFFYFYTYLLFDQTMFNCTKFTLKTITSCSTCITLSN